MKTYVEKLQEVQAVHFVGEESVIQEALGDRFVSMIYTQYGVWDLKYRDIFSEFTKSIPIENSCYVVIGNNGTIIPFTEEEFFTFYVEKT